MKEGREGQGRGEREPGLGTVELEPSGTLRQCGSSAGSVAGKGATEGGQWVKVLATKPKDLSSVPRTHMENRLFRPQPLVLLGILRQGLECWDERYTLLFAASMRYIPFREKEMGTQQAVGLPHPDNTEP